jgi:hypothetical protein
LFSSRKAAHILPLQSKDACLTVHYANGRTQKQECSYGQGFLSQSGRYVAFTAPVKAVEITDFSGRKRTVNLQ